MNLPPAAPDDPAAPDGDQASSGASAAEQRREAARRRARLERIFGAEQLSTRDDLPDPEPTRSADEWYRENRPPHHG